MSRFTIRRTVLSVLVAAAACVSLPAFASKEKPVIGFSIDDLRVERWAPRHELEAHTVVDHREAPGR